MDSFSADWLSLREPADARARSRRLTQMVADALAQTREGPIRILDLGAGTGSNVRFLASYFTSPQEWLLVDHDAALLAEARRRGVTPTAVRTVDLSSLDDHGDLFEGRHLVTASALLDLVSDAWLLQCLSMCRSARAAVLFALNYDGRIECVPEDPEDLRVRDLVNRHQGRDKGFGPALGPDAAARAAERLGALGYEVGRERSDWMIPPDAHELQRQLIEGWARAAADVAPLDAAAIDAWRRRRLAHLRSHESHLLVGHEDVAARLP